MHFQAHKPFYTFIGFAAVGAGATFLLISAAHTGGAIPSPDAAQLAFQFAIMSGVALLIGLVGIAMLFKLGAGFVVGFAMLSSGLFSLIFYNDPYNPYVALYGHVTLSAGIIAIIFHLFFYRFIHWRLTFESGPLTMPGISQTLGFYGLLALIFALLGLLGYYVFLDAPPFPL